MRDVHSAHVMYWWWLSTCEASALRRAPLL